MNYNDAAIKYYTTSRSFYSDSVRLHHCRETAEGCGGLDLGALLPQRLEALESEQTTNREGRPSYASPSDANKIELYVTSWCPYCKMAKDFFRARSIPFVEYDIENDANAVRRKKQLAGKSRIPVAVIYGKTIQGLDEKEYSEALKAQPARTRQNSSSTTAQPYSSGGFTISAAEMKAFGKIAGLTMREHYQFVTGTVGRWSGGKLKAHVESAGQI